MCIVIDLNTLSSVFDQTSQDHQDFAPVSHWVQNGKGFLVFGGTKYKIELQRARRYLGLILQLKKAQRAVEIDQEAVDTREKAIISKTVGTDCDDQHIIAILCVSGCKLVCSKDKRSYRFIKDKSNYKRRRKVPTIYCKPAHAKLLCDSNITVLRNTKK